MSVERSVHALTTRARRASTWRREGRSLRGPSIGHQLQLHPTHYAQQQEERMLLSHCSRKLWCLCQRAKCAYTRSINLRALYTLISWWHYERSKTRTKVTTSTFPRWPSVRVSLEAFSCEATIRGIELCDNSKCHTIWRLVIWPNCIEMLPRSKNSEQRRRKAAGEKSARAMKLQSPQA